MSRIVLLVEGQTEEAFVGELLTPHYASQGVFLTPIIVSTRPGYKGGVVSYGKVKSQLTRLCREHHAAHVTTMFDLYALPNDFPGIDLPAFPIAGTGHEKADFLEAQLAIDIAERNFIPNLMVHEFEALLFAGVDRFGEWTDDPATLVRLKAAAAPYATPEDINNSPRTAPSKRIEAAMPGYQKTFHGPLIACEIGLDAMREKCPHFNQWLQKLEALVLV
ncbi:DUF4276 family protein [Pseudomonas frederiksbergensis]|uniref:DUF4276 family protein n=1 Tax=Pseudomonas frederiksbergensis TaxID=104087 RepID=UPI000F49FD5D|nr:DUF4276 family protein [Pseudomonas frederiksbergensis]RON55360.1 hypothetical protein BK667_09135 [Pseudomonas frederiksbergensis]